MFIHESDINLAKIRQQRFLGEAAQDRFLQMHEKDTVSTVRRLVAHLGGRLTRLGQKLEAFDSTPTQAYSSANGR